MELRLRFIVVIFFITTALISTVHLRITGAHFFYRMRTTEVKQARLKQRLLHKQLQLASTVNPSEISRYLGEKEDWYRTGIFYARCESCNLFLKKVLSINRIAITNPNWYYSPPLKPVRWYSGRLSFGRFLWIRLVFNFGWAGRFGQKWVKLPKRKIFFLTLSGCSW